MRPLGRVRLVSQARKTHKVRCAVCQVEADAMAHTSSVAGALEVRWFRPPSGWWVLLDCGDAHVRCPACLKGEP